MKKVIFGLLLAASVAGAAATWYICPTEMELYAYIGCGVVFLLSLFGLLFGKKQPSSVVKVSGQKIDRQKRIRLLTAEMESAASMVSDIPLRKEISAVAENLRYSDPISPAGIEDLDERITENVQLLKKEAQDQEADKIRRRLTKLNMLINERKEKCIALKHA